MKDFNGYFKAVAAFLMLISILMGLVTLSLIYLLVLIRLLGGPSVF